jgi:TetR/AcrR family transcriptional repressor of nem operon
MQEAGLTSGGFYAHFDSKQALLAEALARAGVEIGQRREAGLQGLPGREWLAAFLKRYLHSNHLRQIENGCPLAALASEVSRADEPVKRSFEAIVRELSSQLASRARSGGSARAHDRGLAALALCFGGLGLARSVADRRLANRILRSCRSMAMEILCPGEKHRGRLGGDTTFVAGGAGPRTRDARARRVPGAIAPGKKKSPTRGESS